MPTNPDRAAFRILDANLDRAAEGLRVAMDLVRFALDDESGSERLRVLRHEVLSLADRLPRLAGQRLQSRDSRSDVGQDLGQGAPGRPLPEVFSANVHRGQEAVRVLEEITRGFSPAVADGYSRVRYALYTLEKEFQPRLDRWGSRHKLDFELYVVTCPELSRGRSLEEVTRAALAGGAGCIQLRAKHLDKRSLLEAAEKLRKITAEAGATFIVNDHLDVALAAGADGVHLGQNDLPLAKAREIAGPALLLGASTHSLQQAIEAEQQGADYINVGPIFPTSTKVDTSPAVGPELIAEVKSKVHTPLTCMGGIGHSNVRQVVLQGAERVAVVSAVVAAEDITAAARSLFDEIKKAKEEVQRLQSETSTESHPD